MSDFVRANAISNFRHNHNRFFLVRFVFVFVLLGVLPLLISPVMAQGPVSGSFRGEVSDNTTGIPISGAIVTFRNIDTGLQTAVKTDTNGRYFFTPLQPGNYEIKATAENYSPQTQTQALYATRANDVIPIPFNLNKVSVAGNPNPSPLPSPAANTQIVDVGSDIDETISLNPRRDGAFNERSVRTLPLGGTTLTRTFDELALLVPGVAPPPMAIGSSVGPGVGPGVGTSGQFAVNGLRSRANNFMVDGSDNNDEDIGVRRQGFFSLVPQSIESIQEFQIITLLAPAEFGRNFGAQVNALSKSGGSSTRGTIYGFFNPSRFNARNFFDTTNGNEQFQLREGNQAVFIQRRPYTSELTIFNNPMSATEALLVRNGSGGKDASALAQFGFVLGGPLGRNRGADNPGRLFYFVSAEGQTLNATKEASFAVPNVAQRGVFNTGLTGLFQRPAINQLAGAPLIARNFTAEGSAILSLFPLPNDPNGIYGANTFTQTLPAGARGVIASGKIDGNFKVGGRQQTATARYNFTNDRRDLPVTGGAIFSSLRSRVRTQNFSTFLNGEVSDFMSNQLRFSYGRTRLIFDEIRDTEFLLPGGGGLTDSADRRFLLNAPFRINVTRALTAGVPNTGSVIFAEFPSTTEQFTGPVGQVKIGGFSPLGADVFNFPQSRVNNTYQIADTLSLRRGDHNFSFGTDIRRTDLNSDLPRNSRPLIGFNGMPYLNVDPRGSVPNGTAISFAGFINPIDQAGTAAASSVLQTLATTDSAVNLRFYQLNFFGQDEWRIRPNLSLSYGLRYEYNTPPTEKDERIENTFSSPLLDTPGVSGLKTFIDGRSKIFDPDRNNLAPRIGIAYSPNLFGNHSTVIRGGFGGFYDQIIGAVVSQSRNVFPNFLTLNTGGGLGALTGGVFGVTNPAGDPLCTAFNPNLTCSTTSVVVNPATLNQLNPALPFATLVRVNSALFPGGFGATLPARQLDTPKAYHYSFTFEQQLRQNLTVSAAYVGTQGHNLLRFTTPNLGENVILLAYNDFTQGAPTGLGLLCEDGQSNCPQFTSFRGIVLAPGTSIIPGIRTPVGGAQPFTTGGRPVTNVGAVTIYETTASSRYDALQLQARGRFANSLQYQLSYTLSSVTDDVSDVFDLAGASVLPQNSSTFEGERGAANFDARHRFTYNFTYELPSFSDRSSAFRAIFGGLEITSTGKFQTGQPFTVNSIFDVNLDGNLTDRLNTTSGIVVTEDRRQPLRLTVDPATLRAPIGQDGAVGRNTFRTGNLLELDLSLIKNFALAERRNIVFRMDVFNFINRANFGVPVRFLESPGFGQATDTVTPGRRVQLALKYIF